MQSLIVSMMRLSTAMTLFGLEQLQSSIKITEKGNDLDKVLEDFRSALDSLSDVLVKNIGEGKKGTLTSITEMTEDVVKRSFDSMSFADPMEMMKSTNELIRKSTDAVADWVGKVTSTEGEEPKPAAEVLAGENSSK